MKPNPIYGYLTWAPVEIHLSGFDALDPKTTTSVCYLFVDDADALHAAWSDVGIDGRLRPPMDTPQGKREFGYFRSRRQPVARGVSVAGVTADCDKGASSDDPFERFFAARRKGS